MFKGLYHYVPINIFQVMPVLIFFSATIGILYYLGALQVLIEKISFIMEISLGTGAMESLHAAINIFVGWVRARISTFIIMSMLYRFIVLNVPYKIQSPPEHILGIKMEKSIPINVNTCVIKHTL